MKKITLLKTFLIGVLLSLLFNSCKSTDNNITPDATLSADAAIKWGNMTVSLMKALPKNTPTYGSRALGYLGLTMYESVVNGTSTNKSLVGQLNGLPTLPSPEIGKTYVWALSLNAGQAYMIKQMFGELYTTASQSSVDSLEKAIKTTYSASVDTAIINRSVKYGQSIAKIIFNWSTTDGGHQGYLQNFTTSYVLPKKVGIWSPPIVGQSPSLLPLHPYWGNNRTFVALNGQLPVPAIIAYSSSQTSDYYKQFKDVYDKSKILTQTEKEIAAWWGDDPALSYSPPGHSYNLANIAIKSANPDLFKAAQTYARVGLAVADAFICCWKCKYNYAAERPSSYIRAQIDGSWLPFWPEPPFPAFSSGHAIQSAASAVVMTDLYGTTFKFTDNTNAWRTKDTDRNVEYKSRSYNSFLEAAAESALSRFYGQIHTNQDNDMGAASGKVIGQNINALKWTK